MYLLYQLGLLSSRISYFTRVESMASVKSRAKRTLFEEIHLVQIFPLSVENSTRNMGKKGGALVHIYP